jgi:hypothetical protein
MFDPELAAAAGATDTPRPDICGVGTQGASRQFSRQRENEKAQEHPDKL